MGYSFSSSAALLLLLVAMVTNSYGLRSDGVCAIANAQKTDTRGWFLLCVAIAFSSSPGSFLPSFVISFPLLPFSFRLLLWSWKKKTKTKQTFSV